MISFADKVALHSLARELGSVAHSMKGFINDRYGELDKVDRDVCLTRIARDLRALGDRVEQVRDGK